MRLVFSLDRHAAIHYDSVLFLELSSESRKVAIVGSASEVTHEFSLEQGQIQGNSWGYFLPSRQSIDLATTAYITG